MAQRSSLSGRSPFCQLIKKLENIKSSKMIWISVKLCKSKSEEQQLKSKKHWTNRGQERRQPPRECRKQQHRKNRLEPSDQGTLDMPRARAEITHVRWRSQVCLVNETTTSHKNWWDMQRLKYVKLTNALSDFFRSQAATDLEGFWQSKITKKLKKLKVKPATHA